ncbi:reverse transcriptase domain-containing protein [Tanacetum coccineum]
MMSPLSLTGEAKTWLDELNEGTFEYWDDLRTAFISRFFPPALFDRPLREIQAYSQHEHEILTDASLRMKDMLRIAMAKNQNPKPSLKKTVAFADEGSSNSDTNKVMARMDAMTMKMDAQNKEIQSRAKCNHCRGNQSTTDCNDDDTPMSHEEEAKFMQTF